MDTVKELFSRNRTLLTNLQTNYYYTTSMGEFEIFLETDEQENLGRIEEILANLQSLQVYVSRGNEKQRKKRSTWIPLQY